jgi:hypothetical protein
MNDEDRQRRLDRVRFAIRAELLIGLLVTLLTGFLLIASPGGFRGMFYVPPWTQWLLPAASVLSFVVWLWMLRLSRPRLEAGEPTWRYRAWRD